MTTVGKTLRTDGAETRARLKQEAQRLFAERGMEGVSVQDIISAAGQRNSASLRYYFGTKSELARELVIDGARLIDEDRQALLDGFEADGRVTIRNVLKALTLPVLNLASHTGQATYIRMIANLQLNDRAFLRAALADTWNIGYRRCLSHLRELLMHVPQPVVDQRLSLLGISGNAILAAWEASSSEGKLAPLWSTPYAISGMLDTFESMLSAAPSEETNSALGQAESP